MFLKKTSNLIKKFLTVTSEEATIKNIFIYFGLGLIFAVFVFNYSFIYNTTREADILPLILYSISSVCFFLESLLIFLKRNQI